MARRSGSRRAAGAHRSLASRSRGARAARAVPSNRTRSPACQLRPWPRGGRQCTVAGRSGRVPHRREDRAGREARLGGVTRRTPAARRRGRAAHGDDLADAPCPRRRVAARKKGTSAPSPRRRAPARRTPWQTDPRHRAARRSAAAASALPPPRPAATGMSFSSRKRSAGRGPPTARRSAATARSTRLPSTPAPSGRRSPRARPGHPGRPRVGPPGGRAAPGAGRPNRALW